MKKSIRIGENAPHPLYIPKDLVDEGFVGDTYMLINAKTATIVHPKASLEDVEKSLEIVLEDIRLRKRGCKKGVF